MMICSSIWGGGGAAEGGRKSSQSSLIFILMMIMMSVDNLFLGSLCFRSAGAFYNWETRQDWP